MILSAPVLTAMKFDAKEDDEFYRWVFPARRVSRAGQHLRREVAAGLGLDNNSSSSTMFGYTGSGMAGYGMWGDRIEIIITFRFVHDETADSA